MRDVTGPRYGINHQRGVYGRPDYFTPMMFRRERVAPGGTTTWVRLGSIGIVETLPASNPEEIELPEHLLTERYTHAEHPKLLDERSLRIFPDLGALVVGAISTWRQLLAGQTSAPIAVRTRFAVQPHTYSDEHVEFREVPLPHPAQAYANLNLVASSYELRIIQCIAAGILPVHE